MNFDIKKLSLGDKLILGSAVLAIIAMLLPWVVVECGEESATVSGCKFLWYGLAIVIFWGDNVYNIIADKHRNLFIVLLSGALALLDAIYYMASLEERVETLQSTNIFAALCDYSYGFGLYLYIIAAVLLIVGGILNAKGRGDSFVNMVKNDAKECSSLFSKKNKNADQK